MDPDIEVRPFDSNMDDEKAIVGQWSDELLKVQSDRAGTQRYIDRQIAYDMGNIKKFYDGSKGQFFVAVSKAEQNKLIGFAAIGPLQNNPSKVCLMRVNILDEYRNRGIATRLCATAIDWCKATMKIKELGATIDTTNLPSQALCKKLGFAFHSWYYKQIIGYWRLALAS